MGSVAVLLGFALYAATIIAIHRWIDGIPARVVLLLERERGKGEQQALDALQAAAGARVAQLVSSLCQHEEQSAAVHHAREVAAENRTRVAEGRAESATRKEAEVVTALEAASALVAQLRAVVDRAGPTQQSQPTDEPGDPQARKTVEMKLSEVALPKAGGDDEPEEEKTQVAKRPVLEAPSSSGLRLAPGRAAISAPPTSRGAAS